MIVKQRETAAVEVENKNKRYDGAYSFREGRADDKLYAEKCVGLVEKGVGLTRGKTAKTYLVGEEAYAFRQRPKKVYSLSFGEGALRRDLIYVYAEDKKLYEYNLRGACFDTGITFESAPQAIAYVTPEGEQAMLFVGKDKSYVCEAEEGRYTKLLNAPKARAAALHYERLFVADEEEEEKISFSRALDVKDWTADIQGAGSIRLPDGGGRIEKLVSIGTTLYLVRKKGISTLRAMGDNKNFVASESTVDLGNIAAESVARCGKYILFVNDRGVCRFDGGKADVICSDLARGILPESAEEGFAFQGEYFFFARTEEGERKIFCVDPVKEKGYLLPFTGKALFALGELLFLVKENGEVALVTEEVGEEECIWESGTTDFSLGGKRKTLKRIFVRAAGKYTFTIESDEGKRMVRKGKDEKTFLPMLRGRTFRVTIRGKDFKLFGMEVEADEY